MVRFFLELNQGHYRCYQFQHVWCVCVAIFRESRVAEMLSRVGKWKTMNLKTICWCLFLRVYPFIVVFTSEEKQFYSVIRTHVIVS